MSRMPLAHLTPLVVLLAGCSIQTPQRTEILWDTWGIPHIYAPTADSLFFGFGWAQMESHADLILELYGEARARGAEYWGPEKLQMDMFLRTVGAPRIAEEWNAQLSPQSRVFLDAFANGINAYAAENPDRISERVKVVLPVTATDVLAHSLRAIHFTFIVGAGVANAAERYLGQPPVSGGSNAWAIGPSRTASGSPILLANPHLPWQGLFLFYEAHFNAPGIDAYGTTLVGFPVPVIAFNDYLGWTHTVNTFDGHDEYTLRLGDGGYYYDGEIRPFDVDSQTVLVREGDDYESRQLVVRRSIHGPVIAKGEDRAIALRITGLDAYGVFDQYWDMLRARNLGEFEAAVSQLQMPMFTTMYADRDGHIMHLFGGRTPVRPRGDWRFWSGFVPGDSSSTLWTEIHPYEDLPKVVDPESGWLQNANDPPWTTTFPRAIDPDDYPPYMAPRRMPFRPQRSARMLAEDEEISFEEAIEYKLSTRMELADRLLDDLVAAARDHGDQDARAAADVLEAWDRNADASSRGAVLFGVWRSSMNPARLFAIPWSPERPRETPAGLADPEEAADALGWAARETKKKFGDMAVAWGDVYRLRYGEYDYPGNGGPGAYGIFRVVGYASDADGLFRSTSGDSYVAIVEFTDPVRAVAVMSYGNATQAHTGHVGDQLRLLAAKEMRVVWRTRAEIEANLESRTVF